MQEKEANLKDVNFLSFMRCNMAHTKVKDTDEGLLTSHTFEL